MRRLLILPLLAFCCRAANLKLVLLVPFHTLSGSELLPRKLVALVGLLAVKHVNQHDFGLLSSVDALTGIPNVSLFLEDTFSDPGIDLQRVPKWSQVENVHALVGPSFSSVAVPLSYAAGALALPVLSYGATSVTLSVGHPFFSRVVPTDAAYARALAKLVDSFGWRKVGMLYVDDDFGAGMFREFAAAAEKLQITIAAVHFKPENLQSLAEAMRSLRNAMVRTIVVVTHETSLDDIARRADDAGLIGGGATWLLGNPNVQPTAVVADASDAQELSLMFSGWIGLLRSNSTEDFGDVLSRLKPTDVDFQSIPLTQAELSAMPKHACPTCGFAYDAIWTLAFAAARLSHAEYADGASLNRAIRQVRFRGVSGTVALNSETGDPVTEERVFHVVNWAMKASVLERKKVAELDVLGGLTAKDEFGPDWSDGSRGWTGPKDWLCATGSVFNSSTRQCDVCPAGSSASKDTQKCEVCSVGSVAGAGFGSCTRCQHGYADEAGMEQCTDCPENTIRLAGTTGVSVTECSCRADYYLTHGLHRGQAWRPCAPCPSGGVCPGGSTLPFPLFGYWGDSSCQQNGGDTECVAWDSFLQCVPAADCLGGPGAPCNGALTGRMCKETRPGWFSIGSRLFVSCDKGGTVWSIVAMLATALAWFGINSVASGEYDAMDICLLYVQVTGIVSSFGLRWHPSLGMLNTCLSIANFDTDFVTPRCLFDWGPQSSFYLQLTLPFIWALAFVLWSCILALYRWAVRGQKSSVRYIIRQVKNPAITSTISLLIVVYHSICLKCFQAFSCTRFPNGRLYLSSAPQVECWTGPHWGMVALATIYIAAFVAGLPAAVVVVVRAKEKRAQLNTVAFHSVWGRLYSRYRPGCKWWEAVLLLRRLLLSLISVFVAPPMLQSALAVAVLAALLTLHAYVRPYTSDAVDKLEVFTLFGSMLYALFGLLFYPSISPSSQGYVCPDDAYACGEDNAIKAGIAMLLLTWTIATVLLAVWVSFYSIRETSMSKKASSILRAVCKTTRSSSPMASVRTAFARVSPLLSLSRESRARSEAGQARRRSLSSDSGTATGAPSRDEGSRSNGNRFALGSSRRHSVGSTKVSVEIDAVLQGGPLMKWASSDQPPASLEAAAKAFELLDSYSSFLATSKGDFPFSALVVPECRTSLIHSLIVSGPRHRRNFTLICGQIQLSSAKAKLPKEGEAAADDDGATVFAAAQAEGDEEDVEHVDPNSKQFDQRPRHLTFSDDDDSIGAVRPDALRVSSSTWSAVPAPAPCHDPTIMIVPVGGENVEILPEEEHWQHRTECGELEVTNTSSSPGLLPGSFEEEYAGTEVRADGEGEEINQGWGPGRGRTLVGRPPA